MNINVIDNLSKFCVDRNLTAYNDLRKIVSNVPTWESSEFHKNIPYYGEIESYATFWIAGGALRRILLNVKEISDYDFFFTHDSLLVAWEYALVKDFGWIKNRETDHHVEYIKTIDNKEYKIQAIKMYYGDVETLFDSFDFTICQFAVSAQNFNQLLYTPEGMIDNLRKRLVINKITYVHSTLRRVLKYSNQGYYACSGCLNMILLKAIEDSEAVLNKNFFYID